MKTKVIESQSTTISDDIIDGEICFRLENVPLGMFLGLRGKIRNLLGDGPMLLDHMAISEKALIVKNQIEQHPELGVQAISPPIPSDPMHPARCRNFTDNPLARGRSMLPIACGSCCSQKRGCNSLISSGQ